MRTTPCLALLALAATASAQHLERVYNRDTHQGFNLKKVQTDTLVKGPIVKQKTFFTFDNPFTKLTEASVWFSLDWAAVLSGFAYWYKDEYVPGVLMDKNKAWFIYTAITSRNEDPGIMVQTSPSSYHAQIYPLAVGHDLRVELDSVGFLQAHQGELVVPQASFGGEVPYERNVRSAKPETLATVGEAKTQQTHVVLPKKDKLDLQLYAQRHRDGYTYVAGMLRTDTPNAALKVKGLHNVLWTRPQQGDADGSVKLFIGRRKGSGSVSIASNDPQTKAKAAVAQRVKANERGTDTAKLWAHQKLVQGQWRKASDVLKFSLQYQIPSSQTALLAVPQEQMKLFKAKEAEFRRKQAEEARRQRAWQQQRKQNWQNTRGGDPELRVNMPDAVRVTATLPDGREFELQKAADGFWGGNFDIPADAPEGEYTVRIEGVRKDGSRIEDKSTYTVDRTAPEGKLTIEDGFLVLRSEQGLARVTVVFGDGKEDTMIEVESGLYKLPLDGRRIVKVVLFDKAHNLREIAWVSP